MAQKITGEELGEIHSWKQLGSSGIPPATANYLGMFYGIGTSNVRPGYINQKGNLETIVTNVGGTSAQIQHGAGVITATASNAISLAVTFPVTYLQAPTVIITNAGDHATSSTYGSGALALKKYVAMVAVPTTTGFTATVFTTDGTNWTAGSKIHFTWMAIGLI